MPGIEWLEIWQAKREPCNGSAFGELCPADIPIVIVKSADAELSLASNTSWAAKEAAYKATFAIAQGTLRWKHFSLTQSEARNNRRPTFGLSRLGRDQATQALLLRIDHAALAWHLSVSHDADLIIAMIVLEHQGMQCLQ